MGGQALLDLHIHSALSPCASDDMRPPATLLAAERRGIAIAGIVDHNTARNAEAYLDAAQAFDVRVLPGIEAESAEGVHIVALFATLDAALEMDALLAGRLPDLPNRPEFFGNQLLLDAMGDVVGEDPRMLAAAVDLSIEEIADAARGFGGMAFPAHTDRRAYGLFSVLGLFPHHLRAPLVEVASPVPAEELLRAFPQLAGHALLRGSDAHGLDDVGSVTTAIPASLAMPSHPLTDWETALAEALGPLGGEPRLA